MTLSHIYHPTKWHSVSGYFINLIITSFISAHMVYVCMYKMLLCVNRFTHRMDPSIDYCDCYYWWTVGFFFFFRFLHHFIISRGIIQLQFLLIISNMFNWLKSRKILCQLSQSTVQTYTHIWFTQWCGSLISDAMYLFIYLCFFFQRQ